VALRERAIARVARLLTRAFFRSVEVEGEHPPVGPVVLAASHLYGFVDPVVLVARLGALPRYLAKSTLWNVTVAGWLLNFAGVIPVHRREDGAVGGDNTSMFASAVEALADGSMVAVFPEGTTHDDPTIRPLRTGVARIAMEAAAAGVEGVQILPVGITYEDKVRLRGRAIVSFGEPIPVTVGEGTVGDDGQPSHEAVRALTARLTSDLQDLTPHFATTEEELALAAAATASLTTASEPDPPTMARVSARSRRLARLDPEQRNELVSLVARYRMLLGFLGLEDADLVRRGLLRALTRRVIVLAILVVLLAPFALAGLFMNLLPAVLLLAAGLTVRAPVSKGTVRLLVAVVVFPAVWVFWAFADSGTGVIGNLARQVTYPVNALLGPEATDRTGWEADLIVLLAGPVLGVVALLLVERIRALLVGLERWWTLLDRRGQLTEARERRAELMTLTHTLLYPGPSEVSP